MLRLLRDQPSFSERFMSYMLARNLRIEADLVDHLFNSSEKRLARALLLLARHGDPAGSERRKFRDLGFIGYNGDIKINASLLSVVLHD